MTTIFDSALPSRGESRDEDVARLRVPPQSIEAEQSVLGGLLLDNGAWDRAADVVTEADFYRFEHKIIFGAIGALIGASKPADVITVYEHLQMAGKAEDSGGLAYLNALAQSVPSAANMRRYSEIVRERAMRRSVIAMLDEAMQAAREQPDLGGTIDEITSNLGQLLVARGTKAPRSIAEIAVERIDHYSNVQQGLVVAGWATHLPWLNSALNGGLQAGSLYILAARPSKGKSSLAWSLGFHLAESGLPVLFLSMEMPESQVADRGIASAGDVSLSAMLSGRMTDDHWSRATAGVDRLARVPLFLDDQPSLTLRAIRMKAKSIKGLKVLVVDYLQLCASTRRDGNRNGEIEEISRGLKALAKELGIAVVALSQLNRDVEKRGNQRPSLSDLRDSGAIEQDADVVLFLWPVRELPAEGIRILGLGVDKNRQGRLGEIGLDFRGDTQRWSESAADIRHAPPARNSGGDL